MRHQASLDPAGKKNILSIPVCASEEKNFVF